MSIHDSNPSLPPTLVLDALRESTSALETNKLAVEEMRKDNLEFREAILNDSKELRAAFKNQASQMDNLVTEIGRSNDIREKEYEERQLDRRDTKAEKIAIREEKSERRDLIVKVIWQIWETFRTPVGTLLLGAAGWIVYTYFNVPK